MRIEPLSCHRQLIPTIARLLNDEWSGFAPWSDVAAIEARFCAVCDSTFFPKCLVALSDSGEFLGTASVKVFELPNHTDKEHWLGEVFVTPSARGQGIGTGLAEEIIKYVFSNGATSLFLYTPDQQAFYQKLGWEPLSQDFVNAEIVTIMVRYRD